MQIPRTRAARARLLMPLRVALLTLIAITLVIGGGRADERRPLLGPRIVYVLRHVEKAAEPKEDPGLTEAGRARALALARTLGQAGVEAIFVTNTVRSKESAAPLADSLGLVPVVYGADDPYGGAQHVIESRARVAVIFGHSDTVAPIIEGLGVQPMPDLGGIAYDDLFVVAIAADGKASVSRQKYGAQVEP